MGDEDVLRLARETERVLDKLVPNVLRRARLRPPLAQPDMDALILAAGQGPIPDEVRALLAWRDGQEGEASVFEESTDLGGRLLMPLADILKEMREARAQAKTDDRGWWNEAFVPFARSEADLTVIHRDTGDVVHWFHDFEPSTICRGMQPILSLNIEAWRDRVGS